jgi:hypothetical protein
VTAILLGVSLVFSVLMIGFYYVLIELHGGYVAASQTGYAPVFRHNELKLAGTLAAFPTGLVGLATAIIFCCWVHAVNRNLDVFGIHGRTYTPGWAVGWFFVPVVNFFMPLQAMRELWKASDPNTPSPDPQIWRRNPVTVWMTLWWVLWLASMVLGVIGAVLWGPPGFMMKPYEFLITMGVLIFAQILRIGAAGCLMQIVWLTQRRQRKKHALLFPPAS